MDRTRHLRRMCVSNFMRIFYKWNSIKRKKKIILAELSHCHQQPKMHVKITYILGFEGITDVSRRLDVWTTYINEKNRWIMTMESDENNLFVYFSMRGVIALRKSFLSTTLPARVWYGLLKLQTESRCHMFPRILRSYYTLVCVSAYS